MKLPNKYTLTGAFGLILTMALVAANFVKIEEPAEIKCEPEQDERTIGYRKQVIEVCKEEIAKLGEYWNVIDNLQPRLKENANYYRSLYPNELQPKSEPSEANLDITYEPTSVPDWFYLSHYNVGDPYQNDESPCIGAAGADICKHLENGGKAIALVAPYRQKYGIERRDRVLLEGDASCRGEYTVLDEMNKRFRDRCIVGSNSEHCIRGDIAYPYGEKGLGGNCYIKQVIKG